MKKTDPVQLPAWRALLSFIVSLILIIIGLYQLGAPFRKDLAQRFLSRGDTYLASLQYDQAEHEYTKALSYDKTLTVVTEHMALANEAPTDIAKLRNFFAQKGVNDVVSEIDKAQQPYENPKDALTAGVAYYEKGLFVYAQYPLQKSTSLDSAYPEAWHYLALTYDELAKQNATFVQKAKDARTKRDLLTPKYLNL
jgi:Tfp pilus assembly protein PilF